MVFETRTRGRGDTPTPFGHTIGASRKLFACMCVVAFVLHLPLVPTGLVGFLDRYFQAKIADYDDRDAEAIVPVELDLLNEAPSAENRRPEEQAASAGNPSASPRIADVGGGLDAGVDAGTDAGANDGGVPGDAGVPAGPAPLRDPTKVAGAIGAFASKDANVQVLVNCDRIRKNELAAGFARLLTNLPEWKSFFEGSNIDPIRDFDHLLIAGPRFKRDSSKVVAIMDHQLTDEAVHDAIDAIVKRSAGAWLEGTPIPAAQATAAKRERILAYVPKRRLLAILPPEAKDQLEKLQKSKGFNRSSQVGIVIAMVTPARPMGAFMKLPSGLKWMRLAFTPNKAGGELRLEFGDVSPEDAKKNAKEISESFEKARNIPVPLLGTMAVFDATEFVAEGSVIKTRLQVTELQLRAILGFATARFARFDAGVAAPPEAGAPPAVEETED